ncbi:MAG: DNA/RNA non-specific endonuclease [Alistipes onderdonkii]
MAATGNGSYPRNFAMGYDKAKKAALWAAYPLHAYYTAPNASKERAYSADPSLGKTEQMVDGVGAPYNKGHQVPNADRKVSNLANKQISYYSNMTPQLATFNSGAWGTLENRVRGWMCADTLYVVTGCYFDGTEGTTTDNGGNPCPVPTHYYKVLLRTKQGTTGQPVTTLAADELQCIGFWYEQTTDKAQTPDNCAMSVAEIEAKCGFEFFVNVPNAPKSGYSPGSGAFRATDTEPQRRSGPCTAEAAFFVSRRQPALSDRIRVEGQRRGRTILQQEGRREVSTGSNRIRPPGGATAAKAPGKDKGARGRGSIDNSRIKRTMKRRNKAPEKATEISRARLGKPASLSPFKGDGVRSI